MNYKDNEASTFDGPKAPKDLSDEYGQSGKLHFKSPVKSEIETQRYKQDCRKRALEQAHYTASGIAKWIEENNLKVINRSGDKKDENEVLVIPSELVKQEIILPIADKYYNWLISIPQ